jgi:predicted phage-related endonuclease
MKQINLIQNTPEWYDYRTKRIGASDFALFACYKGLSEPIFAINFNDHIYKKINNISLEISRYMQHGIDREPVLLSEFNEQHNTCCSSAVVEYENDNRIFTSLDGYDPFSNIILEIKTSAKSESKYDFLYQYYKYQLVHQMFCSGKDETYLKIEYADACVEYIIQLSNIGLSKDEWYSLCCEYLNILNAEKDYLIEFFARYDEINKTIKELKAEQEEIKEKIQFEMPNGGVCGNYTITKYTSNSVSYAQFIKDIKLEVPESYCKKSMSYKITNKEKNNA